MYNFLFLCQIIIFMKRLVRLLFFGMLLFMASCKKDAVDGSSIKAFQESVNDMASSLNTLQQTKFNEALYILKTFAAEGDTDMDRLEALAKLINDKKVSEIFSLADKVARKNNIDWSSTAPPSLGEMNIFQNISAVEIDPNDISASSLEIIVRPVDVDSVDGAKALRVIPRLLDNSGNVVEFFNAGLETIMEVYSNGEKLSTSKNLMTSNEFKGFYLKLESLPVEKIVDAKIDIKISVKTTKRTYQLLKTGISVNKKILEKTENEVIEESFSDMNGKGVENPEQVVAKFLSYLGSQNFRAAYDISENPNWGTYDKFSNPNSGFGGVKSIHVKNISMKSISDKNAVVNAVYQVVDSEENIMELGVSYTLKQSENIWKISNYKINSSEKQ